MDEEKESIYILYLYILPVCPTLGIYAGIPNWDIISWFLFSSSLSFSGISNLNISRMKQ